MKRAADASLASRATRATSRLTVVAISVVLVAACSTGSSARRVSPSVSSTVASTTARASSSTTIPAIAYRVKRGESLTAIADRFHVSVPAIVRRNHIANPDRVPEGRVLMIPPAPPLTLIVRPVRSAPGQAFQFTLNGAKPSETITFEIESSAGKYRGGPHIASASGAATATYQTAVGDAAGIRNVTAIGNMGTTVRASFRVVAPTPSHT